MTKGYCEELIGQEDWEFLVQLCGLNLHGYRVSEPLYLYRRKSDKNSKHVLSTFNYGLDSRYKIINKNEKIFKKNSIGVIKELYEMNQALWLNVYDNQRPYTHIKWLITWVLGERLTNFIKKIIT